MTCPVNISSLHAATGSSTRTPLRVPFLRCHPSPPLFLCFCFLRVEGSHVSDRRRVRGVPSSLCPFSSFFLLLAAPLLSGSVELLSLFLPILLLLPVPVPCALQLTLLLCIACAPCCSCILTRDHRADMTQWVGRGWVRYLAHKRERGP